MNKRLNRLVIIMTAAIMVFACGVFVNAETVDSGQCGDNLTWTLDDQGTLTISGTGEMYSYYSYNVPWCDYKEDIKALVLEEGITSIGDYAFYWCKNIVGDLVVPSGVEKIGNSAFMYCFGMKGKLEIPNTVTTIGRHAFYCCDFTGKLEIPDGVNSIGESAFWGCEDFSGEIIISEGVNEIGKEAFYGCRDINKAIFLGNVPSKFGENVFGYYHDYSFTIYYYPEKEGWTTPCWNGYRCKPVGEETEEDYYVLSDSNGKKYDLGGNINVFLDSENKIVTESIELTAEFDALVNEYKNANVQCDIGYYDSDGKVSVFSDELNLKDGKAKLELTQEKLEEIYLSSERDSLQLRVMLFDDKREHATKFCWLNFREVVDVELNSKENRLPGQGSCFEKKFSYYCCNPTHPDGETIECTVTNINVISEDNDWYELSENKNLWFFYSNDDDCIGKTADVEVSYKEEGSDKVNKYTREITICEEILSVELHADNMILLGESEIIKPYVHYCSHVDGEYITKTYPNDDIEDLEITIKRIKTNKKNTDPSTGGWTSCSKNNDGTWTVKGEESNRQICPIDTYLITVSVGDLSESYEFFREVHEYEHIIEYKTDTGVDLENLKAGDRILYSDFEVKKHYYEGDNEVKEAVSSENISFNFDGELPDIFEPIEENSQVVGYSVKNPLSKKLISKYNSSQNHWVEVHATGGELEACEWFEFELPKSEIEINVDGFEFYDGDKKTNSFDTYCDDAYVLFSVDSSEKIRNDGNNCIYTINSEYKEDWESLEEIEMVGNEQLEPDEEGLYHYVFKGKLDSYYCGEFQISGIQLQTKSNKHVVFSINSEEDRVRYPEADIVKQLPSELVFYSKEKNKVFLTSNWKVKESQKEGDLSEGDIVIEDSEDEGDGWRQTIGIKPNESKEVNFRELVNSDARIKIYQITSDGQREISKLDSSVCFRIKKENGYGEAAVKTEKISFNIPEDIDKFGCYRCTLIDAEGSRIIAFCYYVEGDVGLSIDYPKFAYKGEKLSFTAKTEYELGPDYTYVWTDGRDEIGSGKTLSNYSVTVNEEAYNDVIWCEVLYKGKSFTDEVVGFEVVEENLGTIHDGFDISYQKSWGGNFVAFEFVPDKTAKYEFDKPEDFGVLIYDCNREYYDEAATSKNTSFDLEAGQTYYFLFPSFYEGAYDGEYYLKNTNMTCSHSYGSHNGICNNCGEEIPEHVHNMAKTPAKAASCTENGNSAYWTCSDCNKYYSDENGETEIEENSWVIDALNHTYDQQKAEDKYLKKAADCTNKAVYYKSCTCGATSKDTEQEVTFESGKAKGHDYNTDKWESDETNHWHKCKNCDVVKDEDFHTWNVGKIATKPSDNAEGKREFECAICHKTKEEIIPSNQSLNEEINTAKQAFNDITEQSSEQDKLDAIKEFQKVDSNGIGCKLGNGTDGTMAQDMIALEAKVGAATVPEDNTGLSGVSIIGGGLNREDKDKTPSLKINLVSDTTEIIKVLPEGVDENSAVVVEMDLIDGAKDSYGNLLVPVLITFNIPDGMDANKFVVVHMSSKGTEIIRPVINGNKASIVVTHFSRFVLAENETCMHDMDMTDAVAPTCTTAGNSEYYYCSKCQKYFSGEAGQNEIQENTWILNATGHTTTTVNVVNATCTSGGYTGDVVCTKCHATILTGYSTPATGHYIVKNKKVNPTCCSVGYKAHYECAYCHTFFEKKKAKKQTAWKAASNKKYTIKKKKHSYTKKIVSPQYLKSAATTKKPAYYRKACKWCGAAGKTTFKYGKKLS